MMVGQSCSTSDNTKRFTDWDHSKLGCTASQDDTCEDTIAYSYTHPDTIKDELGLQCRDPFDEATCPRARRCMDPNICHTDQPNWSDDGILQRPFPLGWGPDTPPFLDPNVDHGWTLLEGRDYTWHLEAATWAVNPRSDNDNSWGFPDWQDLLGAG